MFKSTRIAMGLFNFRKKQVSDDELVMPRHNQNRNVEDDPLDTEFSLKQGARRRVIGAFVLVLAAIGLLPLVFDKTPKTINPNINIQVPNDRSTETGKAANADAFPSVSNSQNTNTTSTATSANASNALDKGEVVVNETGSKPSMAAVGAAVGAVAGAGAIAGAIDHKANVDKQAAEKDQAAKDLTEKNKLAKEKAAKEKVAKEKAAKEKAAKEKAAKEKAAKEKANEAKAKAAEDKPNKDDEAKKEDKAKPTKYLVLVGSFSTEEKVSEWRKKMKAVKVPSYVEHKKLADGDRILLRAGPFKDRAAAESAERKLKALGLTTNLVEK